MVRVPYIVLTHDVENNWNTQDCGFIEIIPLNNTDHTYEDINHILLCCARMFVEVFLPSASKSGRSRVV